MNVQLKSKEGEIFTVPLNVIKCASNITYVMNTYKVEGPFPLPNISSSILHKIITWATYHKDDPEPVENYNSDDDNENEIEPWDVKLLNVDSATIAEIKKGATSLGIKALHNTCEALSKKTEAEDELI